MKQERHSAVPALARGLSVIEYLAAHSHGCVQKEIAEALRLPAVGVMRIVSLLEARGYVRKDAAKRTYRLSGRLFETLRRAYVSEDLVEAALPSLRELSAVTGETAVLGVLSEDAVTVIDSVPGTEAFHLAVEAGHRAELHASAPGKALLAVLPDGEREQLLSAISYEAHTTHTVRTRTELESALARIRKDGYALDLEEDYEGVRCAAAPVYGRSGRVVGVVWIAGPASRLKQKTLLESARRVTTAAKEISNRLS